MDIDILIAEAEANLKTPCLDTLFKKLDNAFKKGDVISEYSQYIFEDSASLTSNYNKWLRLKQIKRDLILDEKIKNSPAIQRLFVYAISKMDKYVYNLKKSDGLEYFSSDIIFIENGTNTEQVLKGVTWPYVIIEISGHSALSEVLRYIARKCEFQFITDKSNDNTSVFRIYKGYY
jgi:hypothetical protein